MKISIDEKSLSYPTAFEIFDSIELGREKILIHCEKIKSKKNNPIICITGKTGAANIYIKKVQEILCKLGFNDFINFSVGDGSIDEVKKIDALCATHQASIMLAIGAGRVIDVAKMVVRLRSIKLIIFPTALSSDCVASPVSVLKNELGRYISLPSGVPFGIFIDLSVVSSAPKSLQIAGVSDILSNASALLDLELHESISGECVDGFAKILSESSYQLLTETDFFDIDSIDTQKRIAKSSIISGIAMGFAGNSLPCSGAEHLISHALDIILDKPALHGQQVGLGIRYCNALRIEKGINKVDCHVLDLMNKLNISLNPLQYNITKDIFMRAVIDAPLARAGRINVLTLNTDISLLNHVYDKAFD